MQFQMESKILFYKKIDIVFKIEKNIIMIKIYFYLRRTRKFHV